MLPSEKEGSLGTGSWRPPRSSWKTFPGKTLSESWDLGGREGRNGVRGRSGERQGRRGKAGEAGIWDEDEGQGAVGKEGMKREKVCVG